jgi:hypothetical protein
MKASCTVLLMVEELFFKKISWKCSVFCNKSTLRKFLQILNTSRLEVDANFVYLCNTLKFKAWKFQFAICFPFALSHVPAKLLNEI